MLAQLRLQYPQSCLISELLEIKHGKYIVRALVQVEGVSIATGLGSGETVEIAEDHARERVLAILDLEASLSTTAIAPVVPATPLMAAPVTPPQVENLLAAPVMTAIAPPIPTPLIAPPIVVVANPVIQPVVTETPAPIVTEIPASEIKTPVDIIQPQPKIEEEIIQEAVSPQETSPQPPIPTIEKTEKVEKTEKIVSLHIVPDTQPAETYPQPVVAGVPDLESSKFSAEKEEKKAKSKTSPVAIPDIKDVMAKTEIEIRRLGWTTQQGRNFLLQRYGKRARTLLSDEELLDFLSYLEDQPVAE